MECIEEAPIPKLDPIGNVCDNRIFIRLRVCFDLARTNSAMTHVLVLSGKVRRIEWLWRTLNIGNMFGPSSGFTKS